MTIEQIIDGINRGGFTFIGILFVGGCIAGLVWVARIGFPQTMARIDRILDQIDNRFVATQANSTELAHGLHAKLDTQHGEVMTKLHELEGRA